MGGMMGGGGGKGGGGAEATAGGGVSPQQAALAQYNFGQNEIFQNQQYAQTPQSTMKTQADAGNFAKKAFELAAMSDKDAKAMADSINQQQAQQQQALGNLAESAGAAAGSAGSGQQSQG